MSTFDQHSNPLDSEQALARHIERALAVEPPTGRAGRLAYAAVRRIFRPTLVGVERLPPGPCLFVGNHSLFALDGLVLGPTLLFELDRFVRGLGDRFLFGVEPIAEQVLRSGGVMGHPAVCSALMEAGHDLLVFPGGAYEATKPASQRYRLQWRERYGFVRLAAQHGYTIAPFGMVGPDEFYDHLIEGRDIPGSPLGQLLRSLGLLTDDTRSDILPPIPIGALGTLLPKPQPCYIGFAEPLDLARRAGKRLSATTLEAIRSEVASRIEGELAELMLLRSRDSARQSLLRRLLTV
jgi:1-acyl-sn-glycerol-3-phosphate acyltransferase